MVLGDDALKVLLHTSAKRSRPRPWTCWVENRTRSLGHDRAQELLSLDERWRPHVFAVHDQRVESDQGERSATAHQIQNCGRPSASSLKIATSLVILAFRERGL